MNAKKIMSAVLTLAITLSLTACNSAKPTESNEVTEPSNSSIVSGTDNPESHYPVTITTYDYAGNEIETIYEKAPEKVICVYQGTIETMIALGLEDKVMACYGLDNPVKPEWEAGLAKMNYNEEVFAPDKETVAMMEPDMIFSWGSLFGEKKLGDVNEWISNGTNTYISTNTRRGGSRTLENEYTDILNIGKIFDVEDKAQAIVDEMKDEISGVLEKVSGQDAPNVSVIEFLDDSISNYGADSLGGDMVTALGGTLAAPDVSELGKEDLVNLNPDVIFIVFMARTENVEEEMLNKLLEDPAFADLDAVKNNRAYTIMLGDMYASTVRSIDGIRTFAAGMYPELYQQD